MYKQRYNSVRKKVLPAFLIFWLSLCAHAEPIWHCSRSLNTPPTPVKENFLKAEDGQSNEVIRLTIRDLYDAYQDIPVYLGKSVLSACFLATNDAVSKSVLEGIGTDQNEIKKLATQSNSKRLIMVKDEVEMLSCIAKHHPAIGYASGLVNTAAIGPCF